MSQRQRELQPGFAGDHAAARRGESGLLKNSLRGDVRSARLGGQHPQAVIGCGLSTEVAQSLSRDSASGDLFGNPIANPGRAVLEVVEVEATDDRSVAVNEDVKGADAGVLLS